MLLDQVDSSRIRLVFYLVKTFASSPVFSEREVRGGEEKVWSNSTTRQT
jgi:hypothetical protein